LCRAAAGVCAFFGARRACVRQPCFAIRPARRVGGPVPPAAPSVGPRTLEDPPEVDNVPPEGLDVAAEAVAKGVVGGGRRGRALPLAVRRRAEGGPQDNRAAAGGGAGGSRRRRRGGAGAGVAGGAAKGERERRRAGGMRARATRQDVVSTGSGDAPSGAPPARWHPSRWKGWAHDGEGGRRVLRGCGRGRVK
jgi:hypothetical protein